MYNTLMFLYHALFGNFCSSVSVCATAGWVKDASKDTIPCNGDACDGDKCCKLNDATPAATSPTTTGIDASTTAEANYTMVQFVGARIDTSFDDYHYFGDANATVDIERKVDIVKKLVDISYGRSSINHNSNTLKILVFPEFLFRGFLGAYKLSDFLGSASKDSSGLLHQLATIVNHAKYADWLFVFGSIVSYKPTPDRAKKYQVYNVSIIQRGHSDPHDSERRRLVVKKFLSQLDFLPNNRETNQELITLDNVKYPARVEELTEFRIPMNAAELRIPVDNDGIFVFFGITFGLELCADNGSRRLKRTVRASSANLMQIQIVTSSGGLIRYGSVSVESEGLVFISDRLYSRGFRSARSLISVAETVTSPFGYDTDWKDVVRGAFRTEGLRDTDGPRIVIYEPQLIPPKQSSEGSSKCTYEEFLCDDKRTCILLTRVCNSRRDCSDGSDERNCPTVRRERTRAKCVVESSKVDVCRGCRIDCAVIGIKCTFRNSDGLSVEGRVQLRRRRDPWKRNICRIPKSRGRSFVYAIGNCNCPDDCRPGIHLSVGVALLRGSQPYLHREDFLVLLTCAPGYALKGSTNPQAKVCNSAGTAFAVVDGGECVSDCEQAILPTGVVVSSTSSPVLFRENFQVALECAVGYLLRGSTKPQARVCNSHGLAYTVDHEDACVIANPVACTCTNGIPLAECATARVTKCSSCDSDYYLDGDVCVQCSTACSTIGTTCKGLLLEVNRLDTINGGVVSTSVLGDITNICRRPFELEEYLLYTVGHCVCNESILRYYGVQI